MLPVGHSTLVTVVIDIKTKCWKPTGVTTQPQFGGIISGAGVGKNLVVMASPSLWTHDVETGSENYKINPAVNVEPITIDRSHIGVKLPILCEINNETGSPTG